MQLAYTFGSWYCTHTLMSAACVLIALLPQCIFYLHRTVTSDHNDTTMTLELNYIV